MRLVDLDYLLSDKSKFSIGSYSYEILECLLEGTPIIYDDDPKDNGMWKYTFEGRALITTPQFIRQSELLELINQFGPVKIERVYEG